jgi:hypothetical protein
MVTPFGYCLKAGYFPPVTADDPSAATGFRAGLPLRVAVSLAGDFRVGLLINGAGIFTWSSLS